MSTEVRTGVDTSSGNLPVRKATISILEGDSVCYDVDYRCLLVHEHRHSPR